MLIPRDKERVDSIKKGNRVKKMWAFLLRQKNTIGEISRYKATEIIEMELTELENIFGMLVLGSFIGLPSPPMQITLDLIPELDKEFLVMLNKIDTAHAPMSELFSGFDVG
ncbi:MAG: hypothetical protein AB7W47_11900 [Calditrichaceae bacterium]